MREIKFRGLGRDTDTWQYGSLIKTKFATYIVDLSILPSSSVKVSSFMEVGLKTIGQYTGLKDRNGVEIYEGDVIQLNWDDHKSNVLGVVHMHQGAWEVMFDFGNSVHHVLACNVAAYDGEIIGNIHQASELIK